MDGVKYDNGKLLWNLLPAAEVEDVVRVLTMGANKYSPDNWKVVPDAVERYYAALLRHLIAWRKGELTDPESGLPHLAHVTCNTLFLQWLTTQTTSAVTIGSTNAQPLVGTTTSVQNAVN